MPTRGPGLSISALLITLVVVGMYVLPPRDAQSQAAAAIPCNAAAPYDASTNGSTKLVTGTQGRATVICGWLLYGGGTANVKFISGTGTVCATGAADLTPAFALTAQANASDPSPYFKGISAPPLTDVCINTSAGVAVQAILYYTKR